MDQDRYRDLVNRTSFYTEAGKVTKSVGMVYEAYLPGAGVGSICRILKGRNVRNRASGVDAEVIGFRDKRVILMPYEEAHGINNDSLVVVQEETSHAMVGTALLGRVIDPRGNPIDGKGPIETSGHSLVERSVYAKPTSPLDRAIIKEPLDLGVRSINGLLTCGKGQRVGIMAGSGVGKSVLLGMMARRTSADVNVIALIGERGREVREFIEKDLGPEGLARSVVIVATSDESPLVRMRGAFLAATVAEYFRDQRGLNVLLLMDSVTRFCMAQREIGLSMGEPPASKGYTPSVFSTLPKLLERAGTSRHGGSITGLYTVLVEGDDMDEPIADAARSILDGHIVLSRKLAQKNHFPAIDVLQSASRVMKSVIDKNHDQWAAQIKDWMAAYNQAEDLINIGAYAKGSNLRIDQAVAVHDRILSFLKQDVNEKSAFADAVGLLQAIFRSGEAHGQAAQQQQQPRR